MKKIFIINGGQKFGHSGGRFNETIANATAEFFSNHKDFEVQSTNINEDYNPAFEVEKFVWADVIIYHTPIWWFQLPHGLKKYIDVVFTEGHDKGIYRSDVRSSKNPTRNYGTGGMLHGKKYKPLHGMHRKKLSHCRVSFLAKQVLITDLYSDFIE
jgi:NADPH dehydrogenase (quinone)